MITAQQARQNTIHYEVELYQKTEAKVLDVIEVVSKSIEYHSKQGFDSLDFVPYEKSRFPSEQMMTLAQQIFDKILKSNGFEILDNDISRNILKIKW